MSRKPRNRTATRKSATVQSAGPIHSENPIATELLMGLPDSSYIKQLFGLGTQPPVDPEEAMEIIFTEEVEYVYEIKEEGIDPESAGSQIDLYREVLEPDFVHSPNNTTTIDMRARLSNTGTLSIIQEP